eukprot:TRINITY_DN1276_c0_g1_i4.p1 TRINITY_DN1276_c0_g1~~TRINITY_DN1276_c0_g1_i4.p1  ORF type:complete len:389 (-),score=44.36 TRINITY_DN1276_c0_g1_i4:237-1403(-)
MSLCNTYSLIKQQPVCCRNRLSVFRVRATVSVDAPPKKATQRVQLGDSDLLVSECCLGTMTWGKQNVEEEAHQQLNYAFDMGINFMDTAEMYPVPPEENTQGSTDRYIGRWMKNKKRDDIILATKVAGHSNKAYMNRGDFTRVTPDQIRMSVDESLKRLQTDYIDLLQIHWPDRYVSLFGSSSYDISKEREFIPFEAQLEGLKAVIDAGKVRYVGVSNETSYGVSEFVRFSKELNLPKIQTIQNGYNLLFRVPFETDLSETCRFSNVSLLAYSPLAGGALSGKYTTGKVSDKWRFNLFPGYMERYNKSFARLATLEYMEIAKKYGMTLTQMSIIWCQSRWFTKATIIGATNMEQLKEDITAFDCELPEECVKEIEEVFQKYRDPTIGG